MLTKSHFFLLFLQIRYEDRLQKLCYERLKAKITDKYHKMAIVLKFWSYEVCGFKKNKICICVSITAAYSASLEV